MNALAGVSMGLTVVGTGAVASLGVGCVSHSDSHVVIKAVKPENQTTINNTNPYRDEAWVLEMIKKYSAWPMFEDVEGKTDHLKSNGPFMLQAMRIDSLALYRASDSLLSSKDWIRKAMAIDSAEVIWQLTINDRELYTQYKDLIKDTLATDSSFFRLLDSLIATGKIPIIFEDLEFVDIIANEIAGGNRKIYKFLSAEMRGHPSIIATYSKIPTSCAVQPAMLSGPDDITVDLRPQFKAFNLVPRGQGSRPTCSIFTTVAALEFACARVSGNNERLSVEYSNWAANQMNGRSDDGDFFKWAIKGYQRYGIVSARSCPYRRTFRNDYQTFPNLRDGKGHLRRSCSDLYIRWIREHNGVSGLNEREYCDVLETLIKGNPVAVGSSHSRLLVGYYNDPNADGGGVFLTLDSTGKGSFSKVTAKYVRERIYDAFVVEPTKTK